MGSDNKSRHQLQLVSRNYGGIIVGVIVIAVGLLPWLYPSLDICTRLPEACSYGTPAFVTIGLLLGFFGTSRFTAILDLERDQFQTIHWRPYRTLRNAGVLSDITGTLEMSSGGYNSRRSQLVLLDVNADCQPVTPPGMPGSRRLRKAAASIRQFLGFEESRSLDSWNLKPSLSELASSLRSVAVQEQEAETLRAAVENAPSDIASFRQLALRLMRLERRDEAGAILRQAHRRLLDRGERNDANQLAGIIRAFRL